MPSRLEAAPSRTAAARIGRASILRVRGGAKSLARHPMRSRLVSA